MAGEQGLNGGADIEAVLTSRGVLSGAALERVRRLEAESGERIDLIAAKLASFPIATSPRPMPRCSARRS